MPAIAIGQTWKLNAGQLQITGMGKLLASYKVFRAPGQKGVQTRMSGPTKGLEQTFACAGLSTVCGMSIAAHDPVDMLGYLRDLQGPRFHIRLLLSVCSACSAWFNL